MAVDHIPDAELLALPVAELIDRWPPAVRVLLNYRMACVGCDFSGFDTLAEAVQVHGLQPAELLVQLRYAIRSAGVEGPTAAQGGVG